MLSANSSGHNVAYSIQELINAQPFVQFLSNSDGWLGLSFHHFVTVTDDVMEDTSTDVSPL
jgi:hypothetical protein